MTIDEKKAEFRAAWDRLRQVICWFGICEMEGRYRGEALDLMSKVLTAVNGGFSAIAYEQEQTENRKIIKLYREGKLVEAESDMRGAPN